MSKKISTQNRYVTFSTQVAQSCRGGEKFLRKLFEPLGYIISVKQFPLDETYPEWGLSNYFTVKLSATVLLSLCLTHLYVLIPVLDNNKHYWVGDAEVEKLIRHECVFGVLAFESEPVDPRL